MSRPLSDLRPTAPPAAVPAPPGSRRPRVALGLRGGLAEATALLTSLGVEVVAGATSGPALHAACREHRPEVLLAHATLSGMSPAFPGHLRRTLGTGTILLVPASLRARQDADDALGRPFGGPYPAALLAHAERIGCLAVAAWPPDPTELALLIEHAVGLVRAAPVPGSAAPGSALARVERALLGGQTLAVRGSKGGCGKTEVVSLLALSLAARGRQRVLVIDLDLGGAILHRRWGLPADPARGMDGLAAHLLAQTPGAGGEGTPGPSVRGIGAREDGGGAGRGAAPLDLAAYTTPYTPPGGAGATLDVLIGPQLAATTAHLTSSDVLARRVLAAARDRYAWIVVDLGNLATDVRNHTHLALAALAETLLVVTDPAPSSLALTADGQDRLRNMTGLDPERCGLVLNRVTDPAALDLPAIVARCGGLSLWGVLREDPVLVAAQSTEGTRPPWILSGAQRPLLREAQALVARVDPSLGSPPSLPAPWRAALRRLVRRTPAGTPPPRLPDAWSGAEEPPLPASSASTPVSDSLGGGWRDGVAP